MSSVEPLADLEPDDADVLEKNGGTLAAPAPQGAAGDLPITPSQGLTVLKEMWGAGNRFAALQREYAGRKIPIEKIFGALLGFGDKPDPLADVKRALDEINAKLDRVLAGIQEIQKGLLGVSLLAVYLDIADSVFLIEKYSEALPNYLGGDPGVTDADRRDFADKLLGARSERDGVSFCAQKIIKLGPHGTPMLFDLLYPYISDGVKSDTAYACYLRGAYAFRFIADVLMKGMLLEIFVATATGDQAKMSERTERVTRKYRAWMRTMIDNSFLPFAERLATLNFADEYAGRNGIWRDSNLPMETWKRPSQSILESADMLVARLMGYSKAVTLRVIPNAPPIAPIVPASPPPNVVASGHFQWEPGKTSESTRPDTTKVTRSMVLETLRNSSPPFFSVRVRGSGDLTALHVSQADISFANGASPPPGFNAASFTFLRYEYDLSGLPDRTQFSVILGNPQIAMRSFPIMTTPWTRVHIEEGQRFPERTPRSVTNVVLDTRAGEFDLPLEGQLSPVLITFAYDMFGQRPGPR
ncbi:MAG TPA: hypothetical protein VHI13_02620 [Candidatus Kapabacteria bacterium]|nr:hypothetical protein [Candidatus Kapabacteria bacterium]